MADRRFWLFSFFGFLWRGLDGLRKTVHLALMLLVLAVVAATVLQPPATLPRSAALVIAPVGPLVEQREGDVASRAWAEALGAPSRETLARDLVEAIERGREDPRISALVLQLGGMGGAGLASLRDVAGAISAFRTSGKPVIAVSDAYSQGQFYLAAHADEIWMHPEGAVFLEGYGAYRTFYREALDKLMVDPNVFRVGEYKAFVEPLTRDDMSPQARENNLEWLSGLWQHYQADVTAALGAEAGLLGRYTDRLPEFLAETGGDFGQLALSTHLVDALLTRSEADERLVAIAGRDPEDNGWRGVQHGEYLAVTRRQSPRPVRPRQVGVVVAAGDIVDGRRPPGMIGGDSTAELLREARFDDAIEAVVLRVSSGGGSSFASEIIAEQVRELREVGKPVVVSMGDVAASGGYWISMHADRIFASPVTITGSIGVGAFFPTVQRGLDWLGVHVDGVGTTEWAGQLRPDRALSEGARRVLQQSVEHSYRSFVGRVAEARGLAEAEVDRVARGRVWLGARAVELDLVDAFGDLDDAVDAAAELAGLEDDYGVRFIEQRLDFRQALLMQLTGTTVGLARRAGLDLAFLARAGDLALGYDGTGPHAGLPGVAARMQSFTAVLRRELERLKGWNDPLGVYLHCFCDVGP